MLCHVIHPSIFLSIQLSYIHPSIAGNMKERQEPFMEQQVKIAKQILTKLGE